MLLNTAFALAASIGTICTNPLVTAEHLVSIIRQAEKETYLRESLPSLMKAQEQKLGINYDGLPRIMHGVPSQLSSDDIAIAAYIKEEGAIYFIPGKNIFSPTASAADAAAKGVFGQEEYHLNLKELADHELAHFFLDTRRKKLGGLAQKKEGEYAFGVHLVDEGLGEVFRRGMNEDKPFRGEWKNTETYMGCVGIYNAAAGRYEVNEYDCSILYYDGGYAFVGPIFRECGVNGIDYLAMHPPKDSEMEDLDGLSDRILSEKRCSKQ